MARIPESTITEIKDRADIVEVVGAYVSFVKKSGQNMFGLCPFHDEKTPSFSVSQQKQIYKCFGCQKGGDAIGFIMDIEHLTYPEAIKFLGDKLGIEVILSDESDESYREKRDAKQRLYDLNTDAARFFYKSLNSNLGNTAREYLSSRGISKSTTIKFGLGYASAEWQDLYEFIKSKNYTEEEIKNSGLFRKNKRGSWYDLYRNRLIFPVIDVMGNIIAFGGRVLDDSNPKYINSPENLIYHKGQHLYGLNLAKRTKADRLIIVEGYLDCIALHQAGFDQAVASLGTALTESQAALVRKYSDEIVLAYDMDNAGRAATLKNIDILEDKNAKTFVLILPDDQDPDDYLRTHKPKEFADLLKEAPNSLDYKFIDAENNSMDRGHLNRIEYQERATDILASIKNPIIKELYTGRVAESLGVSVDSVNELVRLKETNLREQDRRNYRRRAYQSQNNTDTTASELRQESFEARTLSLSEYEIDFLVKIVKYPGVFDDMNVEFKSAWFADKHLRDFVQEVLEFAQVEKLEESSFFNLINMQTNDIRKYLSEIFAEKFIQADQREKPDIARNALKFDMKQIELDYYDRLSNYYSRLVNTGKTEEEEEKIRATFQRVRNKKQTLEQEIKGLGRGNYESKGYR